jgi:hypothetical protein
VSSPASGVDTVGVPPSVGARADELGFGSLIGRIREPNVGIHAALYWFYAACFGCLAFIGVVAVIRDLLRWELHNLGWQLLWLALFAAVAVFLGLRAVRTKSRRAFYLYPGGYLVTAASGRIRRAVAWKDVSAIEPDPVAIGTVVIKPRYRVRIRHRTQRKVTFVERVDRPTNLEPMMQRLHAEAMHP